MTALIDLYKASSHTELIDQIKRKYGIGLSLGAIVGNEEALRREEMAKRVRRYRNAASADFETLLRAIYENKSYQDKLCKLLPVATEQNLSQRIVDEVMSLYDKPAVRTLPKQQAAFDAEEKRLNLHEQMQQLHRMLGLCNEVLVWQYEGIDGKSALKIITPDLFSAIPHPGDKFVMAGVLIDMPPVTMRDDSQVGDLPHYELWDDTYRYLLNKAGDMVDENGVRTAEPMTHGNGRIPGELLHRKQPSVAILDSDSGRDIGIAHDGVVLLEVMIMRLSKSQGERQPVLKGNLADVAKNQPMNGEDPIVLPPGVDASMLDTQTDPDHYITAKKDKLSAIGQTYGLSYEQLTLAPIQDSSGKAYQQRRMKLTELRGEQVRRARVNEALVVNLMGFDGDSMSVDHQEQAIPQDAVEEIELLDLKMRLGADSVRAYLMRKDPDLDIAAADKLRMANLQDWAKMVQIVRALNIPAAATAENPGNDPTLNGTRITEKITTAPLDGGASPVAQGGSARPPVNGQHATAA